MSDSIYDIEVTTIDGRETTLEEHRGDVILIVNTASKCGMTPQFAGLEKLYEDLGGRGLKVLGFPCNQFGNQDPGSDEQIGDFCQKNYGVTFPMHSKLKVNGPGTHPLYVLLKDAAPGLLGSKAIKWNFTKFLVDREGNIVRRFGSKDTPKSIKKEIEKLL